MLNHGAAKRKNIPALGHAVLATLLLCAAMVGYTHHMPEYGRFFTGMNDFLPRYAQARMVGDPQMYDVEAGDREQDRVAGSHISGAHHNRMPWQALLMAPLARLPYLVAYRIWIAIHLAAFALFVWIWLAPRDYVLWGASFFPLAASIVVGQDAMLIALCLAGVLRLAETRRDLTAGLLLALCTAKPHLIMLVPLALAGQRRWRILGGAVLGSMALLILGTAAAASVDWPRRLLTIASTSVQESGGGITRWPSVFQFGMNTGTVGCAVVLAVVLGVLVWRSSTLEAGVATAILGSVLITPHTAIYDLPILLVALPALPLPVHTRWLRILLLTPVPYWALLGPAPWNRALPVILLATLGASAWGLCQLSLPIQSASGCPAA